MTYHRWGDTDFDWKALQDCCSIMYKYGTQIGRVGGQIKEKYGTLRYYADFSGFSMHNLFYPGYCYVHLPQWFHYHIEEKVLRHVYKWTGISWVFFQWQKFWYSYAYNLACKKYPHIINEIICCADYPEFIKNYYEIIYPSMNDSLGKAYEKIRSLEIKIEQTEKKK